MVSGNCGGFVAVGQGQNQKRWAHRGFGKGKPRSIGVVMNPLSITQPNGLGRGLQLRMQS